MLSKQSDNDTAFGLAFQGIPVGRHRTREERIFMILPCHVAAASRVQSSERVVRVAPAFYGTPEARTHLFKSFHIFACKGSSVFEAAARGAAPDFGKPGPEWIVKEPPHDAMLHRCNDPLETIQRGLEKEKEIHD